jgi:hypothetical protein
MGRHQVMFLRDLLEATVTRLVEKARMTIITVLRLTVDVIKEIETTVVCHLPKTCLPKIREGLLVAQAFETKNETVHQVETFSVT